MTSINFYYAIGGFFLCLLFVYCLALIYIREMKKEIKKSETENEERLTKIINETYRAGANRMGELVKQKFEALQKEVEAKRPKPKFIVASGDILPDFNSQLSIAGMVIERDVILLRNHDSNDPVGSAKLFIEEGFLKSEFSFMDSVNFKEGKLVGYPAIGGKVLESHEEEIEGKTIQVIDKFEIMEVSICGAPNADPNIKSFQEQLKNQQ